MANTFLLALVFALFASSLAAAADQKKDELAAARAFLTWGTGEKTDEFDVRTVIRYCSDTPAAQLSRDVLKKCELFDDWKKDYWVHGDATIELWRSLHPEHAAAVDQRRQEVAEEEKQRRREADTDEQRRAALPHNDPGAVDLCPPPRKMTRDGCR